MSDTTPLIIRDGRLYLQLGDRLLPCIAGGNGEGEGSGEGSETPPPANDAGTGGESGSGSTETFDAEYVRKIRAEAASYRKRAAEAEGKLKTFEDQQLTEGEKLRKQAEEAAARAQTLEAALRQERVSRAIAQAAAKVGIAPELASKLVEVELDADGNPQNVEAGLRALLTQYPQLAGGASSSATNPARSAGPTLTLDDVRKMSPQEINARWGDVQKVLAG